MSAQIPSNIIIHLPIWKLHHTIFQFHSQSYIFFRLFSYLYSCNVFAGFRPRALGTPCTAFFRSHFSSSCTGRYPSNPNVSSTSRWLIPCSNICWSCGSRRCVLWYLFAIYNYPLMQLLSYMRGYFVYYPFLTVRFTLDGCLYFISFVPAHPKQTDPLRHLLSVSDIHHSSSVHLPGKPSPWTEADTADLGQVPQL